MFLSSQHLCWFQGQGFLVSQTKLGKSPSLLSSGSVHIRLGLSVLKLFIYFLASLLDYNCITMLCQFLLYNEVNQLYVYIYPHTPSLLHLPPNLLSHPSSWSQSTELISLCYATASHQLSTLHLVVHICQCSSLTSSQLTLPPPRILKSILYACVFIPVLSLGSSEQFFFNISIGV